MTATADRDSVAHNLPTTPSLHFETVVVVRNLVHSSRSSSPQIKWGLPENFVRRLAFISTGNSIIIINKIPEITIFCTVSDTVSGLPVLNLGRSTVPAPYKNRFTTKHTSESATDPPLAVMKSARKGVWLAMAMRQTSTPSVKILGMATESCVGSAASRRASERATRKSFPKEWAIQRSSPDLLRQRLASETCRNFEHQQVESVFVHQQAGIANIAGGVHAQRQRFLILNKNSRNQSLWTLNSRGSMRKVPPPASI